MPGESHYFRRLRWIKPTTTGRGGRCLLLSKELPCSQDPGFAACCEPERLGSGTVKGRGVGGADDKRSLKMSFRSSGVLEPSKSPDPGKQRQHLVQGSERSGLGELRDASMASVKLPARLRWEGSSTQLCPKSLASLEKQKPCLMFLLH